METNPRAGALSIRLALLVSALALNGCAAGTAFVRAPERLPSKDLPPLMPTLRFDVCGPELIESQRAKEGERVRTGLALAAVTAELTPTAGSPVDFTVTVDRDFDFGWSAYLSFFTYSVVPGYAVAWQTLYVDLARRDAAQVERTEHLRYDARATVVLWLPLIVVVDFVFVGADGWSSPKFDDGGFKQMVGRFGDDLRVRLGGAAADASESQKVGVVCPKPKAPRIVQR